MKKSILLLFVFFTGPIYGQPQGIKGQVFWIAENQMPSEDIKKSPHHGVQRELLIYELTHLHQAKQDGVFFSEIQTSLVLAVTTKKDGSFKVKLPPGKYSVFVREPKGHFANLFDKDNAINPVTVQPKQFTWLTVTIDYLSVN